MCWFCGDFVLAEPGLQQNRIQNDVKYSKQDISEDWRPNKMDGIQDRFHPVVIHHVKKGQGRPNQLTQQNQNTQAIFFQSNQQNFDGGFRNEMPQEANFQEQPESHAGEIIPNLVNQVSFQSLDFPENNQPEYVAFIQSTIPTPPPTTTTPPVPTTNFSNSLKTIYVPWIYIPPGSNIKQTDEPYKIDKPPEPNYLPPKPNYLPPKPTYLPPEPTYLPPAYSYPPPPPPPPTYLPPKPEYLPPKPGYLPPEPQPGYSYPIPPPPPPSEEEKEKAAEFTYFFLGRKLWYIPLYFSIYFVIYVGYLVLKAIARHKLKFPHLLHNAAVVSGRDLIRMGLFTSRDFNDMEELLATVMRSVQ
ncbi:hypothetical protein M8J75_001964 [Diaphorina citri]|nr:hypothetical protein M8J75_001964 [Diaphorina citri]